MKFVYDELKIETGNCVCGGQFWRDEDYVSGCNKCTTPRPEKKVVLSGHAVDDKNNVFFSVNGESMDELNLAVEAKLYEYQQDEQAEADMMWGDW